MVVMGKVPGRSKHRAKALRQECARKSREARAPGAVCAGEQERLRQGVQAARKAGHVGTHRTSALA